jgi:hypothetical protein
MMISDGCVSIVIPAFNEEDRLQESLPGLREVVEHETDVEVIVVDDGSTDCTAEVASSILDGMARSSVVRLPWNSGKGAAWSAGVTMARGEYVVLADADLSGDVSGLPRLIAALDSAEVAIGSRALPDSNVTGIPAVRKLTSKAFSGFARRVAGIHTTDSQCGFKAFRASTAKLLFHLAKTSGFAVDVEILALARLLGYRVVEVPIVWNGVDGTHVRPLRDPMAMAIDVVRTRRRCRRAAKRACALEFWAQRPQEGMVDRYRWAAEGVAGVAASASGNGNGNGWPHRPVAPGAERAGVAYAAEGGLGNGVGAHRRNGHGAGVAT